MSRISHRALGLSLFVALTFAVAAPTLPQNSGASQPGTSPATSATTPPQPGGQTQGAAPATAPTPLRASTHLVQINVIVQDKKGNPVTDLTKNDFEIFDQGKQQAIGVFSMEATHAQPAPATPPAPNVYSNQIEQRAGVPSSITVILIDVLNTQAVDMAYARQQLVKFLKTLQPQDRVAIYGLTTRLTVIHDFTSDASSLIAALNHTPNTQTAQITNNDFEASDMGLDTDADLDAFFDHVNQLANDFQTANRAEATASALEAIADHIGRLPGRKNLIWVSGGFPIDFATMEINMDGVQAPRQGQSFRDEVERAARALSNSNVAIYPVDARGLVGVPSGYTAALGGPSSKRPSMTPTTLSPNLKNFDTLNILAERTGGRAFYNTNGIETAVRQAMDDSRVTYVLGYYPDHGQWNGKFREIKIKVNRSGTDLRYRRGYFALPDEPPTDNDTDVALIREAASSPVDSTTLGLTLTTQAVDVPGAQTLKTVMKLEPRDFSLTQQGDHWAGALDVLFVQIDAHSSAFNSVSRKINLNLPQKSYDQIMREGLMIPFDFKISSDARYFRVAVRDTVSGATGTLTIPLAKLFPSSAP